ncbi:MAG: hypothetical protein MJ068_00830 [Clostridia bacterium]|nr:hypothetical protein [Clostridia bacterium]
MDFASRFYPIYATRKAQSLFCIGAEMSDEVDPVILCDAVNETVKQFPSFKVSLKKGFAWYYFLENRNRAEVYEHDNTYLHPIRKKDCNGFMFKFSYEGKYIEMMIFHGLTDGTGAYVFFQAVLKKYRELQGINFAGKKFPFDGVIDFSNTEDGILKYAKPVRIKDIHLKSVAGAKPNLLKGTPIKGDHETIICRANANEIMALAKAEKVSFTAYIAGVLCYTCEKVSKSKNPVAMMIPINLRNFFPTNTSRNFVTFIRIVIKPGMFSTLEEYVREAQRQIKEKATKEQLEPMLSTTFKGQNNFLVKIVPVTLKKILFKIGRVFMKSRQTMIYSNLGILDLPDGMNVDKFRFLMNASKNNTHNMGSITKDGFAEFSFVKSVKEMTLINTFIETLRAHKIDVRIDETW